MPEDARTIQFDQPCAACGYNLRGLAVGAKCPECGLITTGAALRFPARTRRGRFHEMGLALNLIVQPIAIWMLLTFTTAAGKWRTLPFIAISAGVAALSLYHLYRRFRWRYKTQQLLVDEHGLRWFVRGAPPVQIAWADIDTIEPSTFIRGGARIVETSGRKSPLLGCFHPRNCSEREWIHSILQQRPNDHPDNRAG